MMTQIAPESATASWSMLLLFAIFFFACLRVKGNIKFAGAFFHDIFDVRERENMFDVTVRETSFILLTLLLSACSLGVLLHSGVELYGDSIEVPADLPGIAVSHGDPLLSMAICMGMSVAYISLMWVGYRLVGHVFSDELHTRIWLRGFTSSMAFGGLFFFPLALLTFYYQQYAQEIVIVGLIMLILVKFLFIVKGFRIFFTESSSWVVFLYYLCSLEIIPLSITFGLTCSLLGQHIA